MDSSMLIIEKLKQYHDLSKFKSYEPELRKFLVEDALENQKKKISVTYLWFLKETSELIGYVTILTDSISLNQKLKEEFRDENIKYKSLPALKIGRLCVDDRFLRQGIGKLMLFYVYANVFEINEKVGCRFITLDAKRNSNSDKDSLYFYKKMGFEILRERQKGSIPMYKDIFNVMGEIS